MADASPSLFPSVDLVFRPDARLVSTMRRFVVDLCEKSGCDEDTASQTALAAHELLENATQYASGGITTFHVSVDPICGTAVVRTTNRADEARLESLRASFAAAVAADDASALKRYVALLHAVARRIEGSGLGLARIRAECNMILSLSIQGDSVCLEARTAARDAPA